MYADFKCVLEPIANGQRLRVYRLSRNTRPLEIRRPIEIMNRLQQHWVVVRLCQEREYDVLPLHLQQIGIKPVNRAFPWAKDAGEIRWWVLVNMSFNMGIMGLQGFTETLQAFQRGDWAGVVKGMQQSLWWHQVGRRSQELAYQVYFNEWVVDDLTSEQVGSLATIT